MVTDGKSYTYLLNDQTGKCIGQANRGTDALEYLETMCDAGNRYSVDVVSAPTADELLVFADGMSDDYPSGGLRTFVLVDRETNRMKLCFDESARAMDYCSLLAGVGKSCYVSPLSCSDYEAFRKRLLASAGHENNSESDTSPESKLRTNPVLIVFLLVAIVLALLSIGSTISFS